MLFLACRGRIDTGPKAVKYLQEFVASGGSIYISDLAGEYVERIFPGRAKITMNAKSDEEVSAEVVDPGLIEILGPRMNLHYDCTLHAGIGSAEEQDVRVYLRGKYSVEGKKDVYPLVISFNHGEGQVIYTTFHNSAQVSKDEEKLLRYLIFRPMVARAAGAAAQVARAQYCTPGREIIASIDPKQVSDRFVLNVEQPVTVLFVLSWQGQAKLGLLVQDSQGNVYQDTSSTTSPFTVQVTSAGMGPWSCWVKGIDAPHRNFPYVLTLAVQQAGDRVPSPQKASRPRSGATLDPRSATHKIPVYFVIDSSSQMGDARLEDICQEFNKLAEALSQISEVAQSVRMSVMTVGSQTVERISLAELREIKLVPWNASGTLTMRAALQKLNHTVSQDMTKLDDARKPLVFVLLSSRPTDSWQRATQVLGERARRREVNVIVLAMGSEAPKEFAVNASQIPLLVIDELGLEDVRVFFGWLEQVIRSSAQIDGSTRPGASFSLLPLPAGIRVAGS